jgi:hypothetical protein
MMIRLNDGELDALREIVGDWIAEGFSGGHFPADFLGAFRAIGLTGAEVGVTDEDLAAGLCPCRPCTEERLAARAAIAEEDLADD